MLTSVRLRIGAPAQDSGAYLLGGVCFAPSHVPFSSPWDHSPESLPSFSFPVRRYSAWSLSMWISSTLSLKVAVVSSVDPIGEVTLPVTVSLSCSKVSVKPISPREPPWEVHSQVPVKGPGL